MNWSQSAINLTGLNSQATGCVFNNIYCSNGDNASASYPIVLNNCTESVWNQLNVESATLTTSAVYLGGTVGGIGSVTFNSVHCEHLVFNTSNTAVFELGDVSGISSLTVNSLTLQLTTISANTAASIVRFRGGWSRRAIVDGLWLNQKTLNSGASFYFGTSPGLMAAGPG